MIPWLELLGYLASVLVAVSLMMKAIVRLRVINMLGALTFSIYGYLIGSWPVAGMNAFIVGINIYYLLRMRSAEEQFKLIPALPSEPVFRYFLEYYADDIRRNQPEFDGDLPAGARVLLVMRNAVPAGIVIGTVYAGDFRVLLDYVPPQFRDFKIGRFLFEENAAYFKNLGCLRIAARPSQGEHAAYLERLGFKPGTPEGLIYRPLP